MSRYQNFFLFMIMSFILSACATQSPERIFPSDQSQIKTPFDQLSFGTTRKTAFDDGKFIMVEGMECIQREDGSSSATILSFVDMPSYVDSGTIILNGWDLRYLHNDHEVRNLRAEITRSKLVTGSGGAPILVFEVEGQLSDQNAGEAYEFCVHYTGIGYHSALFDVRVEGGGGIDTWTLQTVAEGAVSTLESIWHDGTLKGSDSIAVIPRGFDFQFDNAFECELRFPPCRWKDPSDHHLRQIAYSLLQTDASPNPDGKPHWVTQTIFKDNGLRTHWIKTRASLIGGSGIRLQPSLLALNPKSAKTNICRNGEDGVVRTETVRVKELPYDYAVPMLTAWDLSYECDAQHVQRAGIWIHDINFDQEFNSLEYKVSSILRDKDGAPSFNATHRVTILGINRLPVPVKRTPPDFKIKLR